MAGDGLLIPRSRGGRRPGVRVIVHNLVSQCHYGDVMTGLAHPRSNSVAVHFSNGGRGVRVGAVGVVVTRCEGGRGYNRRIQVRGLTRHEGPFVAELAVGGLVELIGIRARAAVVHAHDHHLRYVPAWVGWVHRPGRIGQSVENSMLVGPDPRDLIASPVLNGYGQVGWRELLAEGG